jgi:CRISPR-associated exonuclease Cas4
MWLALVLLVLGVVLLWLARRRRLASGLPAGRVIYLDTAQLRKQERALYDPVTELSGRPDYLVEKGGTIVPVEVKSGRAPYTPHPAHILQLAAYCLLVEATYPKRPPYGILQYSDRAFSIPYNSSVRDMVFDTLAAMRRAGAGSRPLDRSHESAGRCAKCGYRASCDQRLA